MTNYIELKGNCFRCVFRGVISKAAEEKTFFVISENTSGERKLEPRYIETPLCEVCLDFYKLNGML